MLLKHNGTQPYLAHHPILNFKTMATKTWQVNTLQRELADGYVNKVIYSVNGEDVTYSFRATGEVNLPKPHTLVP